jgi:murein DD-endopeptidase MepM/ murein hydrolase activator NlpD
MSDLAGKDDSSLSIANLVLSRRSMMSILVAAVGAAGAADILGAFGTPSASAAPFPITNWWGPVPASNDDFNDHEARNSPNSGVDWGMPVGTSLKTPHAGTLQIDNSGDLWQANILHSSGWRSELLHVSGFVGGARVVALGDVVALSGGEPGDPGAGSSSGPHLHWSLKDASGTNVDPLLHAGVGGASTQETEITPNMIGFALQVTPPSGPVTLWALAGGGVGASNWIEIPDNATATKIADFLGVPGGTNRSFVTVDQAKWNSLKAAFTAPPTVVVQP